MGILRADLLTHSQLLNTSGSVEFDGTTDFIQIPSSRAWRVGDANLAHKSVTIEWWIYLNTTSGYHNAFDINYTSGLVIEGTNGVYSVYGGGQTLINEGILDAAVANRWYHYALVIHGGPAATPKSIFLYRDGKLSGAGKIDSNVAIGSFNNNLSIGARQSNGANSLNGYISNFRWSDEVVYNSEFTVPKFNLKARPSTLLLCCQSSTSATEAAVSVTGSVTASGNATHSSFNPGLKDDITDTGVVFDGFGSFATSTYMVPPAGKTTERNRGRAIFAGGAASPYKDIQVVDISSGGIAQDFGDTANTASGSGSASSSTRMLITNGYIAPARTNVIEFITIANIASSTDFGDLTVARARTQSLSNSTRGVHVAGSDTSPTPYFNVIDYNTIATAGNAADFGDTSVIMSHGGSVASSTRGVYSLSYAANNVVNTLEFITIATTGNGQDFGDLNYSFTYHFRGSTCDPTRGLFAGGYNPAQNTIDFVTIASIGNASDFGDLTVARRSGAGTANSIHSIFAGGYLPGVNNTIDRVLIQTSGDAADFGDLFLKTHEQSGSSDSHGGL